MALLVVNIEHRDSPQKCEDQQDNQHEEEECNYTTDGTADQLVHCPKIIIILHLIDSSDRHCSKRDHQNELSVLLVDY